MDHDTLTLPDLEIIRTWHLPVALRADDDADVVTTSGDGLGVMDVRFSQFDTWYRIDSWWEGSFMERTARGAFKQTIAAHNAARSVDAHRMVTLFNHGFDFHIGDKVLGEVIRSKEEPDSPVNTVRLFDTSYNRDLVPGLRAGVYGSSFMFRVIRDEWNNEPDASDHNPDGLPERTLKELRVFEAGPVTWPANPDATAGMRCTSGTDAYYEHLTRRDPHRVAELRSRLTSLRTSRAEPAGPSTGSTPDAATEQPTAPATGHPGGTSSAAARARRVREARLAALTS